MTQKPAAEYRDNIVLYYYDQVDVSTNLSLLVVVVCGVDF